MEKDVILKEVSIAPTCRLSNADLPERRHVGSPTPICYSADMSALQRPFAIEPTCRGCNHDRRSNCLTLIVHCSFKHATSSEIQTDFITVNNNYYDGTTTQTEVGTSSHGLDDMQEIDEDEFYMLRGIVGM